MSNILKNLSYETKIQIQVVLPQSHALNYDARFILKPILLLSKWLYTDDFASISWLPNMLFINSTNMLSTCYTITAILSVRYSKVIKSGSTYLGLHLTKEAGK